jgi:pimeloyl-ACP methyl ester carboxylesterase
MLGIDPVGQETEPNLTRHPMTPERAADFTFFVEHDFGAVLSDTADAAALKDGTVRVIPAAGRTTPRTVLDRRCAEELASMRGTALAEFPGGHNGNLTHPCAFAERLRAAFRS